MSNKTDIFIYADWLGMTTPKQIGVLSVQYGRGKEIFSFKYNDDWLNTKEQFLLDPNIGFYSGLQYSTNNNNFGIFLDSMPDTWGRTLMKRREAQKAQSENRSVKTLRDVDFLLGVFDESRMGALRYKLDPSDAFLDDNQEFPTPPWTSIRELQHAVTVIESSDKDSEIQKWLAVLMAPGSSLGGARPKANILDNNNHPWIAKFPSKNDTVNKGAWEFLVYQLAIKAGIEMSESKLEKLSDNHHTFITKRFDRYNGERVFFASAMTMTGNNEVMLRDKTASYLDFVEFIQNNGANIKDDLRQLWKRIVFNIAISNTDDHLRNHGFILKDKGWVLSPAYDINPSVEKDGLSLNIDMNDSRLDFELAKSVGIYFHLDDKQMSAIIDEVLSALENWKKLSNEIGIARQEQMFMSSAFNNT